MMNNFKSSFLNKKQEAVTSTGPTHEQGGVSINQDTEIEGGETVFEGMVFSNRIPFSDTGLSFADKAKEIEKKYSKDLSPIARKTKKIELDRLFKEQETLKAEQQAQAEQAAFNSEGGQVVPQQGGQQQMAAPIQYPEQGVPQQQMASTEPRKMFWGGLIAAGVPAIINTVRGLTEKPRKVELQRYNPVINDVDFSEQRTSLEANAADATSSMEYNVRNNANSAGQLLGNTFVNRSRIDEKLNRGLAESFQTEENINTQTRNQIENQAAMYNTQLANQEMQINNANEDAKRNMLFSGLSQLAGSFGGAVNDLHQGRMDYAYMKSFAPNVAGMEDWVPSIFQRRNRKSNK